MDISTETRDDCLILLVAGRLDGHGSEILLNSVTTGVSEEIRSIIIDMTDVPYLSSAGIRVLLRARNMVKERSGTVILCNTQEFPKSVLKMAGVDWVFPEYRDLNLALDQTRKKAIPDVPVSRSGYLVRYQMSGGFIEIDESRTGPAILQISGSLTKERPACVLPEDLSILSLTGCNYSLGFGALAETLEQASVLLGEMMTLYGSVVWLPADGKGTPDFFTPVRESSQMEIYSGYTVALQGSFHEFFSVTADRKDGITLGKVFEQVVLHAGKMRPDYAGIVAIALVGTLGDLKCVSVKDQDPSRADEREKNRYVGETLVAFGVGVDMNRDLTRFDAGDLQSLIDKDLSGRSSRQLKMQTYGVIFRKRIPSAGSDVGMEIQHLLNTGEFLDMCHLSADAGITSARCAVAYISEIQTR